jgi:hypothetical protein
MAAMENGERFWLERRVAPLPYRRQALDAVPKPLRALVDCGDGAQSCLWRLDWAQLGAAERGWLESGEYLPDIGFLWLDRAAALMRAGVQRQQPVAILDVPARRLTQLAISDLMHVMGSDAWLGDGLVALVWGFAYEDLVRPQPAGWPLACRGAVFPSGDGLDVGWWAPQDDIEQI